MQGDPTKRKGELFFYRFVGRAQQDGTTPPAAADEVESVIAEITLLLNTRAPFKHTQQGDQLRRSVLEYGLADFLHLSPCSRQDAQILARQIRETIGFHESRLHVESVTVETPRPYRDALVAVISGHVLCRNTSKVQVSFPIRVGMGL